MAPAPPDPPVPPPSPRRRWPLVVAVVVGLALLVGLLGAVIRLPYVIYSPGDATPVEGIVKVSGARTYRSRGEVLFLTVSVSTERPNVWRWAQASLDPDSEVVGENSFLQGQSRSRASRRRTSPR